MIEVLAKAMLAASLLVLGAVAVTPNEKPSVVEVQAPSPIDVVPQPLKVEDVTVTEDHLRRLEQELEEQNIQSARISGKLDLLLRDQAGKYAQVRPRWKPRQ